MGWFLRYGWLETHSTTMESESSKSINFLLGPRNSFGIGFVSAHLMINLEFLGIDLCMFFVSIFLQENKIM